MLYHIFCNLLYCFVGKCIKKYLRNYLKRLQMNSKNPVDLSLKTFVKNFVKEVFHLDSRILRTLSTLIAKPGQLTIDSFNNSDSKFIKPLKLYFLINFIFFLVTPILNTNNLQIFNFTMQSISSGNQKYQEIINKQIDKLNVSNEIYEERFNAHIKYNQPALVFLIIPFFALVLKILDFRKKRYFTEHLIFSIHFVSFFLLFLIIFNLIIRLVLYFLNYFPASSIIVLPISFFSLLLVVFLYLLISSKHFYCYSVVLSIFKSIIHFIGFIFTLVVYVQFLFFYTIFVLR